MNCSKCYAYYDESAQYCSQCGEKTIYNVKLNRPDPNVRAVWMYAGYLVFNAVFYRILSFATRAMYDRGGIEAAERIGMLYNLTALAFIVIELIICGIIIFTIKNTSARIAVGLVAVSSLLLYLFDLASRMADKL